MNATEIDRAEPGRAIPTSADLIRYTAADGHGYVIHRADWHGDRWTRAAHADDCMNDVCTRRDLHNEGN